MTAIILQFPRRHRAGKNALVKLLPCKVISSTDWRRKARLSGAADAGEIAPNHAKPQFV